MSERRLKTGRILTKDRSFYRTFFSMAAVLVLQNIVTISVNLADNLMLGGYSEMALSGAAAVNQVQFVYQQILMALGEGIVVLGSQYFGRGQAGPVKKIIAGAMHLALLASAVLFVMASVLPARMIGFFTADAGIIEEGTAYLSIIRFTYVFFAVTQILTAALRSVGIVNISLLLSLLSLGINCTMNYTLIYGHFGAPEMGIRGAAIGTLTARIVEMAVCILYMVRREKTLNLCLRDLKKPDLQLLVDYMRVTLPMLIVNFLWGFNNAVQNSILGHMNAHAIAANSAASTLFLMVKSMAIGAAGTASFLTAKTVGEGAQDKAMEYTRTMQVLFAVIGVAAGIVLYNLRTPILSLYTLEEETRHLADRFLMILSVTVVTMSYQMPTNAGIIKGGGDTKYCMVLDLISIWGIVIPLSFAMAFVVKASPAAVVWCLNADQIFKCLPAFIKVNYGHWMKKLTRGQS